MVPLTGCCQSEVRSRGGGAYICTTQWRWGSHQTGGRPLVVASGRSPPHACSLALSLRALAFRPPPPRSEEQPQSDRDRLTTSPNAVKHQSSTCHSLRYHLHSKPRPHNPPFNNSTRNQEWGTGNSHREHEEPGVRNRKQSQRTWRTRSEEQEKVTENMKNQEWRTGNSHREHEEPGVRNRKQSQRTWRTRSEEQETVTENMKNQEWGTGNSHREHEEPGVRNTQSSNFTLNTITNNRICCEYCFVKYLFIVVSFLWCYLKVHCVEYSDI